MKPFESISIQIKNNQFYLLDQTKLPHTEDWILMDTPETVIEAIQSLRVRGAPLIGVTAVVFLELMKESDASNLELEKISTLLEKARPTAVNLRNLIARWRSGESGEALLNEDVQHCNAIAENGRDLIKNGDTILTHCNTGGLATAGVGTALGVIKGAFEQGKKIHIFVDETRPLLQGARLTTWELQKLGIPYTLICDSMAASLMKKGKIQKIFLGADRIAMNGDFANKIGTYHVAILAKAHEIPFYVAAPQTTIDRSIETGDQIPIEERPENEVKGMATSFGKLQWAQKGCNVINPAFDVTPGHLVTEFIFDRGRMKPENLHEFEFLK